MVDYQNLEDHKLIYRTAQGDKQALEVIYDRYSSAVYSLARYMLRLEDIAEEATQEVFINIWLKSASYNLARGEVRAWIMSVAQHKIIDIIRSGKRSVLVADPNECKTLDRLPSADLGVEAKAERKLEGERVRKAMNKLPLLQREVIFLAYYRGLSQSEIAAKLGQPIGTVKTRSRLGLQKLRIELQEDGIE